jgi:hypothetical protein
VNCEPHLTTLQYDAEATKRLVAVYVTPDVVAQRQQFLRFLHAQPGERILDVGAGPGFLVEAIAEQVGVSGSVVGVDISEPLVAYARAHGTHQDRVEYRLADATRCRSTTRVSTRRCRRRWSNTSTTSTPRSPSCTACFGWAGALRCSIPTGTRSSGTRPIARG